MFAVCRIVAAAAPSITVCKDAYCFVPNEACPGFSFCFSVTNAFLVYVFRGSFFFFFFFFPALKKTGNKSEPRPKNAGGEVKQIAAVVVSPTGCLGP